MDTLTSKADLLPPTQAAQDTVEYQKSLRDTASAGRFDFNRAAPEDLARYGFSWAMQQPKALAAMRRRTATKKLTWIQPNLTVQIGKTHVRQVKGKLADAENPISSNWDGGLVAGRNSPVFPVTGLKLDGYSTEFNNQEHVNFIRPDGHVCELVYKDAWSLNDLTQVSGGGPLAAVSSA